MIVLIDEYDVPLSKANENGYYDQMVSMIRSMFSRESGNGYSDILVEIDEERLGIVIEVKYAEKDAFSKGCDAALLQIRQQDYASVLRQANWKIP